MSLLKPQPSENGWYVVRDGVPMAFRSDGDTHNMVFGVLQDAEDFCLLWNLITNGKENNNDRDLLDHSTGGL